MSFDVEQVRVDFPILDRTQHGKPLSFLDSAASAQKPRAVLEAMNALYTTSYANIHRGVYELSMRATAAFEEAEGDEVLITHMQHHSNIVPWQMLCEEKGATLRVAPIDERGALLVDEFEKLLGPRTKIVALAHVSNALGTVNPVGELVELAHDHGAPVLVDGAQAVPHQRVDVQELGCDFYAFSGHKLFGPSGVGALWGRAELLEAMPPYQGGGEMILSVSFDKTTYAEIPHKFEAGTPDIAGVVGLGAAIAYVTGLGLEAIAAHERELLAYPTERLLEREGVCVRTGHHCAQPVMERFGLPATVRASLALYTSSADVDRLVAALGRVREVFA